MEVSYKDSNHDSLILFWYRADELLPDKPIRMICIMSALGHLSEMGKHTHFHNSLIPMEIRRIDLWMGMEILVAVLSVMLENPVLGIILMPLIWQKIFRQQRHI